jgi:DNA-binding LytR/AlgR family response regulator
MKALKMIYLKEIVRVHKSYIINIDKVERFNSKFAEIEQIPLSRNKKDSYTSFAKRVLVKSTFTITLIALY